MRADEGCVIYIVYTKPIFNTCDFDSKVLLARGQSALSEGDVLFQGAAGARCQGSSCDGEGEGETNGEF